MAGMPVKVVQRAGEVLKQLENTHLPALLNEETKQEKKDDYQLSFFQLNNPLLEEIKEEIQKTDIDTLSPIEALLKLNKIKKHLEGK